MISARPYGTEGLSFNADPGLRCACPGLFSLLPPGEWTLAVSSPAGRRSRWTPDTMPDLRRGSLIDPRFLKRTQVRCLTHFFTHSLIHLFTHSPHHSLPCHFTPML